MAFCGLRAFGSNNQVEPKNHIKCCSAITEVFGGGQQVTAVAVEYDQNIDNAKLSQSSFSVKGRSVTRVYASTTASKASKGTNGRFVIIELQKQEDVADPAPQSPPSPNGQPAFSPNGSLPSNNPKSSRPMNGMGAPKPDLTAYITQTGVITTTEEKQYEPFKDAVATTNFINLIVDDFKQVEFKDPATGLSLKYNLYIPKNYDKNKSYPMVLFMHYASVTGRETTATLTQGLGAVIWASPEEQAKHECFVLAPLFPTQTVNDKSEVSEYLDVTVDLIKALTNTYNINKNRLYTTGQSGGCMMSIAIDIKYPDLFAASFLVAGQWDASLVKPLAKQKLWIIVSEGDTKAFPGMNAITSTLEKEGAKVSRATWNARSSASEFASEVAKMNAEDNKIRYVAFQKGTTWPEGQEKNMTEHMQTWKVAYTIEGVRDWLFAQSK